MLQKQAQVLFPERAFLTRAANGALWRPSCMCRAETASVATWLKPEPSRPSRPTLNELSRPTLNEPSRPNRTLSSCRVASLVLGDTPKSLNLLLLGC